MPFETSSPLRTVGLVVGSMLVGGLIAHTIFLLLSDKESPEVAAPANPDAVTLTYTAPAPEAFENLDFPGYVPQESIADPVDIPLPLDTVSQEFITSFNALTNEGIALEAQLKRNVYPAMKLVQQEAAAGNYLTMFEHMLDAKEQIAALRERARLFNIALQTFERANQTPGMPASVRSNGQALALTATQLEATTRMLADQLDQTLKGSVPEQELLTAIDATSFALEDLIKEFVGDIKGVTDAVIAARGS